MRLLTLTLAQYRNHAAVSLPLNGTSHLFLGPNGSGKTNLLEAIATLSLTKSFLGIEEEDLPTWETDFYRVTGRARTDSGEEVQLEVVSQMQPRREKAGFRNDVRVAVSSLVGELPTVVFLPQDLDLFTGSPAERRRFIDTLLCQVSSTYFRALSTYQKVLKQRNSLLRAIGSGNGSPEDLIAWDSQLAECGAIVTQMRLELMETWSLSLIEEITALGEKWDDVRVHYDRGSVGRSLEELTAELGRQLASARDRDILIQSTTVGPHRDDWQVLVSGRPLPSFASRGQQRVVILALLFLQASYLELRKGERPLILLDDVFSELDQKHQARVLTSFAEHQVFLSGVQMPDELPDDVTVWDVCEGKISSRVENVIV